MKEFWLVLLGAAVSLGGSYLAHLWEAKRAKGERLEARQDAAVAALAEAFVQIERHLRTMPWEPDPPPEVGPDLIRKETRDDYYRNAREWGPRLDDALGPAKIAAHVIRDARLRERLISTLQLLEDWQELARKTPIRRQWTAQALATHAIECLGAWQREETIPTAPEEFVRAWDDRQRSQSELSRMLKARLRNPDGSSSGGPNSGDR